MNQSVVRRSMFFVLTVSLGVVVVGLVAVACVNARRNGVDLPESPSPAGAAKVPGVSEASELGLKAGDARKTDVGPQVAAAQDTIPNELIDFEGFRDIVNEAESIRPQRRLAEADFLAAMQEPGTVLLDARSAAFFEARHIQGAVNLPFTDWTEETLASVIPSKATKVLIYCNNNFLGDQIAFATKMAPASLNLASYTSLMAYGYTNIYELGPLLDVNKTVLPFEGQQIG